MHSAASHALNHPSLSAGLRLKREHEHGAGKNTPAAIESPIGVEAEHVGGICST